MQRLSCNIQTISFTVALAIVLQNSMGRCDDLDPNAHDTTEHHLKRVQEHFASLDSFSLEGELSREVQVDGKVRSNVRNKLTIEFAKPNRILVSNGDMRFASDGATLRFVVAGKTKYIERQAPQDFRTLHHDDGFNVATGFTSRYLLPLVLPEGLTNLMTNGVKRTEYERNESKKSVCLRFHEKATEWELWVPDNEPTPSLLRIKQSRPRLDHKKKIVGEVQVTLSLHFSKWVNNPDLKSDVFAIEKPRDGQPIESLMDLLASGRPSGPDPLLGKSAPPLALESLTDDIVEVSQHLGSEVVVITFWTTWSGTSRRTLPIVARTTAAFRDRDVSFYAVNVRDDVTDVREYLEGTELDLGVPLLDRDGRVADSYGITGFPQSFVVDKSGKVQVVYRGYSSNLETRFASELNAILRGENLSAKTLKAAPKRNIKNTLVNTEKRLAE